MNTYIICNKKKNQLNAFLKLYSKATKIYFVEIQPALSIVIGGL